MQSECIGLRRTVCTRCGLLLRGTHSEFGVLLDTEYMRFGPEHIATSAEFGVLPGTFCSLRSFSSFDRKSANGLRHDNGNNCVVH
jgi:hypothetical protein